MTLKKTSNNSIDALSAITINDGDHDWLLHAAFPLLSFTTNLNAIVSSSKSVDKAKVQTALSRAMRGFWQRLENAKNCSEALKRRVEEIWQTFLITYAGQNNWAHCLEVPARSQEAAYSSGINKNGSQNFLALTDTMAKDFSEDLGIQKFLYILLTLSGFQDSAERQAIYARLTSTEPSAKAHGILVETVLDDLQSSQNTNADASDTNCKKFFSPLMILIISAVFIVGGGLYLLLSKNLNGVLQPAYTVVNDSFVNRNN